jgi:hypothetical protein
LLPLPPACFFKSAIFFALCALRSSQLGMNFAEFDFVYRKQSASLYGEQC